VSAHSGESACHRCIACRKTRWRTTPLDSFGLGTLAYGPSRRDHVKQNVSEIAPLVARTERRCKETYLMKFRTTRGRLHADRRDRLMMRRTRRCRASLKQRVTFQTQFGVRLHKMGDATYCIRHIHWLTKPRRRDD
jgi:hypothetical protein